MHPMVQVQREYRARKPRYSKTNPAPLVKDGPRNRAEARTEVRALRSTAKAEATGTEAKRRAMQGVDAHNHWFFDGQDEQLRERKIRRLPPGKVETHTHIPMYVVKESA